MDACVGCVLNDASHHDSTLDLFRNARTFDTMMRRGARVMARVMLTTTPTTSGGSTTRAIGTSVACEAKAAVAKGKGGKAGKGNALIFDVIRDA